MFDFRYHVVSLAAVFLALVLGILVGAAISDPALADRAENEALQDEVARLEERLQTASAREQEDEAAQVFVDAAYGALMEARLSGRGVAVLVAGPVDEGLLGAVRTAIGDADGIFLRLRAVRVDALDESPGELGRTLGEEFVAGQETPAWDELSTQLVLERSGALIDPADAVVVLRTSEADEANAQEFVDGLLAGVEGVVPAVGAAEEPASVELFDGTDLSIVDNVTTAIGRVSLAVLLAGGTPGHYGVGEGRDALVPPIEAVVLETDPSRE